MLLCVSANAQNSNVTIDKNLIYRQEKTPEHVDNHNYTSYFTAGKDVYNLKSVPIGHSGADIVDFKVNPAGYSYAVLSGKGRKYTLGIYDTNNAKRLLAKNDKLTSATAIVYSPDSRNIYVADGDKILKLHSKDLTADRTIPIVNSPSILVTDSKGMYLAGAIDRIVDIYNEQEGTHRAGITAQAPVADVQFNNEGDKMIVLCTDGSVEVYGTRDFSLQRRHTDLGTATKAISVHPDDKFVAVAADGNRIQFLNLNDDFDRPFITYPTGPKGFVRFITTRSGEVFVAFDADNSLVYKRVTGFAPNFTKMMLDQLNDRMREWTKMGPMETEEEYRARVNPESIERQRRLFANEIATSLAGDLISHSNVVLGNYNPHTGMLQISIGSLPTIYLTVPQEDMATFGDGTNLSFDNAVYGITANDTFELIYVDVFNPTNGKTYTFDNLDREDLTNLSTDDSFISLDLIMKSNREDVLLKGIKDRIVDEAKANNLISEHTHINVDTRLEPAFDANGRNIQNYRVSFDYNVAPGFSEHEDFPAGKYMLETSNAASSLMRIIRQAFESEFASYIVPGKRLQVEITGSADGTPINRTIPYDGSIGVFDNEPVRVNGELSSLSVSAESGIKTNEQLGFLRAQSLRHAMLEQLPQLQDMKTDYRYNIEVSEDRGSEYRRISVVLTFIDIM